MSTQILAGQGSHKSWYLVPVSELNPEDTAACVNRTQANTEAAHEMNPWLCAIRDFETYCFIGT